MSSDGVDTTSNNTGMVAKTLALFQCKSWVGEPGRDPLPSLSINDLSGPEQTALVDAKKRKNSDGGSAGSGSGSGGGGGGGDGAVVINKLDLMSLLHEQNVSTTNATKLLLEQHTEITTVQNAKTLATFGEGIQEKLEQFNC